MKRRLLFAAAAMLVAFAPAVAMHPAQAQTPAEPQPDATPGDPGPEMDAPSGEGEPAILRLGVLAGPDVMATMAAIAPVSRGLSEALGRPVDILPMSSYGAMIDAQVQRRIDGGFYSASAFAVAEAFCECLEPIVAPAAADGTLAYYAIVVANVGAGVEAPADLLGKIVAVAADDSVGGRRMQLAGLLAEGVDPSEFAGVREFASPEEAVRSLIVGHSDAAFAWSSLAGEEQSGYSRGTLAALVREGALDMSKIAVVWQSAPIAHGPFSMLSDAAAEDKAKIEAFLVGLGSSEPQAYDMLNSAYGGGYMPVDPADYDGLAVLAAQDVDALVLPGAPPIPADSAEEPDGDPAQP